MSRVGEAGEQGTAVDEVELLSEVPDEFCIGDLEAAIFRDAGFSIGFSVIDLTRANLLFRLDGTQICAQDLSFWKLLCCMMLIHRLQFCWIVA